MSPNRGYHGPVQTPPLTALAKLFETARLAGTARWWCLPGGQDLFGPGEPAAELHLLRAGDGDAVATLLVHPTDVGRTRDLLAELTAHYRRPLGWLQVREAGHVEPGDLVLETRMGFVQNNLTLTLASLRDLVVQAVERAQAQLPLATPPR